MKRYAGLLAAAVMSIGMLTGVSACQFKFFQCVVTLKTLNFVDGETVGKWTIKCNEEPKTIHATVLLQVKIDKKWRPIKSQTLNNPPEPGKLYTYEIKGACFVQRWERVRAFGTATDPDGNVYSDSGNLPNRFGSYTGLCGL